MLVLRGIAVFFAALALDYADSRNTLAVASGRRHVAARWSVVMFVLGLFCFDAAIEDSLWYALPAAAGLYAGSCLGVTPTEPEGPLRGSSDEHVEARR